MLENHRMASGRSIMRRAISRLHRVSGGNSIATFIVAACAVFAGLSAPLHAQVCDKPVYLTFDTGHMGTAPLIADVLKRHNVKVTFFAANERTQTGDGSLGNHWAPWWKARAREGHEFASHTYDHVYWRGDVKGVEPKFRVQPSSGAFEGREFTWDAKKYCEQIAYAAERIGDHTGVKPLPLFRAPGGKTSPRLLEAAKNCGYEHVGWSPAGFLGDELPSEKYSNDALLKKALKEIKAGDVLVAHLGIWSRKDPWAPAVLEPLIIGLKEKGFCFATLRQHPALQAWITAKK
jgi:peptidoglycan/xylan/chitin deacetylase (PgdA/CDA1 family)